MVNPIEKVSEFSKGLELKSILERNSKKKNLYMYKSLQENEPTLLIFIFVLVSFCISAMVSPP